MSLPECKQYCQELPPPLLSFLIFGQFGFKHVQEIVIPLLSLLTENISASALDLKSTYWNAGLNNLKNIFSHLKHVTLIRLVQNSQEKKQTEEVICCKIY